MSNSIRTIQILLLVTSLLIIISTIYTTQSNFNTLPTTSNEIKTNSIPSFTSLPLPDDPILNAYFKAHPNNYESFIKFKNELEKDSNPSSHDPVNFGDNVSTLTGLAAGLIIITMILEAGTHKLEHSLIRHTHLLAMVYKLYRELMVLGLTAFLFFTLSQTDAGEWLAHVLSNFKNSKEELEEIFEFVHMGLFQSVLIYILICLFYVVVAFNIAKIWEVSERSSAESVTRRLNEAKLVKISKSRLSWWLCSRRERNNLAHLKQQAQYHSIRSRFIAQQKLPSNFNFARYLKRSTRRIFLNLVEIHWSVWAVMLAFLALNWVRYKYIISLSTELGGLVAFGACWATFFIYASVHYKCGSVLDQLLKSDVLDTYSSQVPRAIETISPANSPENTPRGKTPARSHSTTTKHRDHLGAVVPPVLFQPVDNGAAHKTPRSKSGRRDKSKKRDKQPAIKTRGDKSRPAIPSDLTNRPPSANDLSGFSETSFAAAFGAGHTSKAAASDRSSTKSKSSKGSSKRKGGSKRRSRSSKGKNTNSMMPSPREPGTAADESSSSADVALISPSDEAETGTTMVKPQAKGSRRRRFFSPKDTITSAKKFFKNTLTSRGRKEYQQLVEASNAAPPSDSDTDTDDDDILPAPLLKFDKNQADALKKRQAKRKMQEQQQQAAIAHLLQPDSVKERHMKFFWLSSPLWTLHLVQILILAQAWYVAAIVYYQSQLHASWWILILSFVPAIAAQLIFVPGFLQTYTIIVTTGGLVSHPTLVECLIKQYPSLTVESEH